MLKEPNLIDILCGCGYRTQINPDTQKTKWCRNCGAVIYENGKVIGTLDEACMRGGSDWGLEATYYTRPRIRELDNLKLGSKTEKNKK